MESPYQRYLNTNYAPTYDEVQQIEMIVDKSATRITDINVQIDHLQRQLDVLQDQRQKIQTFSDGHRALLSPIRQLSRDILEEIFLACIPGRADRNPSMSAVEAPLLLTRVCSSWRQIAISTPRLWAKIHIILPIVDLGSNGREEDLIVQEKRVRRILQLSETGVKEWLRRSHMCPLSISVYKARGDSNSTAEYKFSVCYAEMQRMHLSFIRNTIVPHNKRWRDLDFVMFDKTLHGLLDDGLKAESLEMLETLHITRQTIWYTGGHGREREPLYLFQWKDIGSLVNVRTKSVKFLNFPITSSDITSLSLHAWRNLTELDLKMESEEGESYALCIDVINFAASILPHCHYLKTLTLKFNNIWSATGSDTIQLPGDHMINLPYLTSFRMALPVNPAGLAFARALYLPSITTLGLYLFTPHGIEHNQESNQEIMKSLLRASQDFHTLELYNPMWMMSSEDDILQLLKFMPLLRCLKVLEPKRNGRAIWWDRWDCYNVINDSLLRALTPTALHEESDIICPKLQELEIDDLYKTGITETCLKEFLMSRNSDKRVSPLRRIRLFIDQFKDEQPSDDEKLSTGPDSAIYFRRLVKNISYEPFDSVPELHPWDCYREL